VLVLLLLDQLLLGVVSRCLLPVKSRCILPELPPTTKTLFCLFCAIWYMRSSDVSIGERSLT